ncbi:3-oxoacyl-[acyl-carrier-protein] synthase 2 [Candidatus Scalindua japonica]|uniref:3-oxoacyl-[acyl-carrier-protein] synthase 2 n=1 Tax=Candidatus Scalindua japonica TaxID=1284222 RepID=A0A286TYD8_9BACT|nr:beta-ketoacyl-ACP synthase II [Candidatus Scalindua japonica]GAX60902.1 3-oxoacyl-[acyl-carrier-protein] synthase 2 [Candidatus Scalindua japonica]
MGSRVAITGLGAITPVGCEKDQLWESLCNGKSGIADITAFDTTGHDVLIAGEAADFDAARWFNKKEERRLDRFSQFAVASAALALEDSGIDLDNMDRDKVGAIIGTGIGGIIEIEAQHKILLERGPSRVSPFMITKLMANAAPGYIAIKFGLRAANFSVITACASGAHAIVEAFRIVQRGEADVMFAGGTEATITPLCVGAFNNMKALSTRNEEPQKASRPFDRDRNGFVISEGSGMVILEEMESAKRRGATIYAEMLGFAMSDDAHHITAPHPEGKGACTAMRNALKDARLNVEQISYINAHATSTHLGDMVEINAIKNVFRDHVKNISVSSTKSMLGHQLGASGGVEALICSLVLDKNVIPPTINYDNPDPDCDGIDFVPNEAKERQIENVMSNSFGFGGHNVSIILGKVR